MFLENVSLCEGKSYIFGTIHIFWQMKYNEDMYVVK